jgi:hypothetical protein
MFKTQYKGKVHIKKTPKYSKKLHEIFFKFTLLFSFSINSSSRANKSLKKGHTKHKCLEKMFYHVLRHQQGLQQHQGNHRLQRHNLQHECQQQQEHQQQY